MVRLMDQTPIYLFSEEVAVWAGHEVLMEVDDNSALIVSNQWGILSQQLRPHPIHIFEYY
jgi:hypothetical protein